MKRKILQIGSLLMALYLLFVALDLNVSFHWCAEEHHLMSSFGDASKLCEHCAGHHHSHLSAQEFDEHLAVTHFDAKCCCEDFNSMVGFTDSFTFSTEKPQVVYLPFTLVEMVQAVANNDSAPVFRCFTKEKIPYLLTGRLKTIFFSNLKLNPLVF